MNYAHIQTPDATSHVAEKPAISCDGGGATSDVQTLIIKRLNDSMQAKELSDPIIETIASTLSRLAAIPAVALSVALVVGFFAWVL